MGTFGSHQRPAFSAQRPCRPFRRTGLIAYVGGPDGRVAEEIGIWVPFQVMTMIAQVMDMVAEAGEVDGRA